MPSLPKHRRRASVKGKASPAEGKKLETSGLISISALACENVLFEHDGVPSAIRIADVFLIGKHADIPVEKQAVLMRVLVICKFRPKDTSDHTLTLQLIRPGGEITPMGEVRGKVASEKYPDAPGGFNAAMQVGIIPKQLGTHYIAVLVDGEEKTRIPITLVEHKAEVAG